ncbi:MAG: metallophosphoesterase family protein, partial [Planctomycetota bacterium]
KKFILGVTAMITQRPRQQWIIATIMVLCFGTTGRCIAPTQIGLPDLEPLPQGIVLGRPTDTSVTAHIMADEDMDCFLEYGTDPNTFAYRTESMSILADDANMVCIKGLYPDTQYVYRLWQCPMGANAYQSGGLSAFHTQRAAGKPFIFVVQSDSHLDEQSIPELYETALANELADMPDFVIDLGDTFMSDKVRPKAYEAIELRYRVQRSYFSLLCHSAPLFLVLGNHDGETGREFDGTADNLAVWSTLFRKYYFPNPQPDGFYTGSETEEEFVGLRQNYYAWHWGDALFVVLDPYWYTQRKGGNKSDNWDRTLGEEQYHWFRQTILDSSATFKFVFCHQLIGGNSQGRGGVESVPYYEMGGHNMDGTWGFDQHRPGWDKPIHQLMVDNNVTIFFHGHDHFFAKQELDGIIYQLVPQPSHHNFTKANQAVAYGYESGEILPNSGHLRVNVRSSEVIVEYVRAYLPETENAQRINGQISHTYHIEHHIGTYTVR